MTIIDSDTKIPIEDHFRVSAGPGAGKTHWLVNHIKNVLQNSTRLSNARKIACITYTNIAVETILKRLGTAANQVEVSTIHSFLYRHVVKPNCSFIAPDIGLNLEKFDGHDDTIVSNSRIKLWLENHPNKDQLKKPFECNQLLYSKAHKKALIKWLETLNYRFDNANKLYITGDRKKAYYGKLHLSNQCLDILESELLQYKKLYWKDGIVDHNDILYFSYELVEKYPFIIQVLQAKFPYFFIDEFQDTNPIQLYLINKIGNKETIVGVIGDKAQSIYSFQGASLTQFEEFSLPNLIDYVMIDNRRSTNQIIDVLNSIRKDIQQNKYRNVDGALPVIFVGDRNRGYKKAKELCNNKEVYSLSRDNPTANSMKKEIEGIIADENLFIELKVIDSNSRRRNMIYSCIHAVELANNGKYKEAIRKLEYLPTEKNDKQAVKKTALSYLFLLINHYNSFKDKTLMDFYSFVKDKIDTGLSKFSKGDIKTFYETHTYQQLALCVNIVDDTSSNHKTIHKAKGDEFNNVVLILKEKDLNFLLKPDLFRNEEHRIYYVAISRAREKLFICVDNLPSKNAAKLNALFNVVLLNG